MKFHPLAPLALVIAAAIATGVTAQTTDVTPPSPEEQEAAMTTPEAFAERAASSNLFEILTSQLALEVSQTEEVRAFAEHMIADHTAATEEMTAAATSEGITPPDTLMPDHQAQLDSLAASAPEAFDAAYLGAQLAGHTEAVTLFEGYSTQGVEGPLKTFATETLPKLQEHLAEVEPLADA